MNFEFSKHAIEQMELRKISKEIIEKILDKPAQMKDENGNKIYQSIISESSKDYLIRIFVNPNKDPNLVITAYKTSNIKKYYEN